MPPLRKQGGNLLNVAQEFAHAYSMPVTICKHRTGGVFTNQRNKSHHYANALWGFWKVQRRSRMPESILEWMRAENRDGGPRDTRTRSRTSAPAAGSS